MSSALEQYAGAGAEQIQDVKTSYLKIAQEGMTAELNKQKPEFMKGLEAGNFFCPNTKKIYGMNMKVIILAASKSYAFFQGLEFKGSTLRVDPTWNRDPNKGTLTTKEGYKVTTCYNYLVVDADDLEGEKMVFTLKNSDIPSARDWNTKIQMQKFPNGALVPLFGTVWHIETMYREKDGKGWFALGNGKVANVKPIGLLPDKFVDSVLRVYKEVEDQTAKVLELSATTGADEAHEDF